MDDLSAYGWVVSGVVVAVGWRRDLCWNWVWHNLPRDDITASCGEVNDLIEKLLSGDIARRLRGICFHGVISIGAQTPIRFVETMWRLRYLQIPTTSATAPCRCLKEPPAR